MRNSGNLQGISLELFIVKACQAALFLIILVIPASTQTQRRPTAQRPTATRPRPQSEVTFADKIKLCLARPADAVMTADMMTAQKNASGTYSGHVDSTRATYASDANDCEYFVVDVILPAGFKISAPYNNNWLTISGEFSDMTAFTENNCPQASFRTIIYRTHAKGKTSYTTGTQKRDVHDSKVHDSIYTGNWPPEGFQQCFFYSGNGPLRFEIPEGGVGITTTYRVLVLPTVNGHARRARVKWETVYVPQ